MKLGTRAAAAWGLLALSVLAAGRSVGAESDPGGCRIPQVAANPIAENEGMKSQYAQLPEHCLKTIYLYCSAASERAVLASAAAMTCSAGHEALLKRVFHGNFDALLAWWREHRDSAPGD